MEQSNICEADSLLKFKKSTLFMGNRNFYAIFKRFSTTITGTNSNFIPKPGKHNPYSSNAFMYSPI